MFSKRTDFYQPLFLIISAIIIAICFYYNKNPYNLQLLTNEKNLVIVNLINKNEISRTIFLILNIFCFIWSIFIADEKLNNGKNLKFLIAASFLFTPFLLNLNKISFIGILSLLIIKFFTSENVKKFIYLALAIVINANFIFLFSLVFFDKDKKSYLFAFIAIIIANYLHIFNYEGILSLNQNFIFTNNISLTSFMALIYKLSYANNYPEYINHINLISYLLFFFFMIFSILIDLRIYKKNNLTDKHKLVLKMLYIPIVLSAPKIAILTNISYTLLLFIIADYLYKEKLLCNACMIGLVIFISLANLFPILSQFKLHHVSTTANFLILFWISAIRLRIFAKLD